MKRAVLRTIFIGVLGSNREGLAHEGEEPEPEPEIVVRGEREVSPASESEVSRRQLELRPRRRPGDLVEAAPGLMSVQHSGGGKANQYFLRGFDIDHGTDLRLSVDGIPVNLPSHGHGQGYADLHFVIPETLSKISVYKGPYRAPFGDFATAGAVDMTVADAGIDSRVSFSLDQFQSVRGLALLSENLRHGTRVLMAGEVYAQDGPFENPEALQRINALGRISHDVSPFTTARLTWMTYVADWNANGQIPFREVEAGRLDRFGSIDPTEGGAAQRHSLSVDIETEHDGAKLRASVYGISHDWRMYSNFTFFRDDPINGDQIEQTDDRSIVGANLSGSFDHDLSWAKASTTFGFQAAHHNIDNGLYQTAQRERLDTTRQDDIAQSSVGLYAEENLRLTSWLALQGGLRFDHLGVDVTDTSESTAPQGGTEAAQLISPKASLLLSPRSWLDLFVQVGRGFHSNDARGATRREDTVDLLVPGMGYEVGARLNPYQPLVITATAFRLDLASEQVWIGDEGTTEASDASSRYGLEFTGDLKVNRIWSADVVVTLNRARARTEGGDETLVPLAPTRTISGGLGAIAPFGTFGAVRVRHIGERPATADGRILAEDWKVLSASAGHRQEWFEVRLDVENLLNVEWEEVQFANESQLEGEDAPVEELHFAPGWPLTIRGTMSAYF